MGRSAKMHKRVKKTASSVSQVSAKAPVKQPHPAAIRDTSIKDSHPSKAQPAEKRRATLKEKAKSKRSGSGGGREGHVLGGADYVDMMMGSRRRAREEAAKLRIEDD